MSQQQNQIAQLIVSALDARRDELAEAWRSSRPVRHLVVDDLLPQPLAERISQAFPDVSQLQLRSSLRERKRVGVQVEKYDPIVADTLYAFQQPSVVEAVSRIVNSTSLVADPSLYAGGISVMGHGDFLNPHIDNSHDGDQRLYRVLNLLYYISPAWQDDYGGHLEVWDNAVRRPARIACRFNRLAIMETDRRSWHSVCRVEAERYRLCVSNYYFSAEPPGGTPYKHVTTFTGRPEEPFKRLALGVLDGVVLNTVGKLFPQLLRRTKHRRKVDPQKPT
jgi:Rps23 Pro-64 3,4-dihydroxylase Tpa1-like proline 4-hydroxylase